MAWRKPQGPNYYPTIFRAVSVLPNNTREARRQLYENAREILKTQLAGEAARLTRERGALEYAIQKVEKSPNEIPGARASTILLIASMWFGGLWMLDATSMSLYWVVRPWSRLLLPQT